MIYLLNNNQELENFDFSEQTILLIDADLLDNKSKMPNLALMKLSTFFKQRGSNVKLAENWNDLNANYIFISKVFTKTYCPDDILLQDNVIFGGTGFEDEYKINYLENLPSVIERIMPDYSLYNKIDKMKKYSDCSIGFYTRGCFRKCYFCVNKKYDKAFLSSDISDFLDKSVPKILLLDDNIFAYTDWKTCFDKLNKTGKKVQFNQGLDIRLLTENKAVELNNLNTFGDIIFAFDNYDDVEIIEQKLNLWRQHSNKPTKIYLLCGYYSSDIEDIITIFKRLEIISKYNCLPYIMKYHSCDDSTFKDVYTQIQRWCNQPAFYKKMSLTEFCNKNQDFIKGKGKCSALRMCETIESSYPEIYNKYFNRVYWIDKND